MNLCEDVFSQNCQFFPGFFCPGEVHTLQETRWGQCSIPGIIEWPIFYDDTRVYERSQIVSWFVDFNSTGNYDGL